MPLDRCLQYCRAVSVPFYFTQSCCELIHVCCYDRKTEFSRRQFVPLLIVFKRDLHSGVPDAIDATKTQTAIASGKAAVTATKLVIPFVRTRRETSYPIRELT